jgi:amino acid transporter
VENVSVPGGGGNEGAVALAEAPTTAGKLQSGAIGLPQAIVISVAVMSPAASIFFNTIPQAGVAGAAIPLCFVIGFVVALLVANQYSELSRELPSSGSSYTFVTEGLGPRWGFLTGWVGLIAIAIGVPYSFVLMSAYLQALARRLLGMQVSWIVFYVAATGIVFAIAFIGVRQSLRVDLTFLIFELGICLALAVLIFLRVGSAGQLTAAPFSVDSVPTGSNGNLIAGIVLAVLCFIGFETASTMGEETRNPHRSIPRAVYGSMLVIGVFYIIMAYALTVGYGPQNMATGYANDSAPFDTIARHFGGSTFTDLIDVVAVLSFFSAALAIVNGGARILYSVGRDGLLPRGLAWTHPTRQTPGGAIGLLCALGLISGIPLGLALTPATAFGLLATLDALFILIIYTLTNVACIRFFWRQRREKFNLLKHGIIPSLGTLITAGIFVLAVLSPGTGPLQAIPFVIGGWLVLGLLLIMVLRGKLARS